MNRLAMQMRLDEESANQNNDRDDDDEAKTPATKHVKNHKKL